MWPFSKKEKQIGGFIGQANLVDWWLGEFDDAERSHIVATFQPMGSSNGGQALIEGDASGSNSDPSHMLYNLAGWFKQEADRTIAFRIIDKATELLEISPSILTKHFTYQARAEIYYRWRDLDSFALERATEACRNQIAIAKDAAAAFLREDTAQGLGFLPAHHGYKQLAIILEKQGDLEAALNLSREAKEQGWNGDWDARIGRLEKRLAKAGK